MTTTPRPEPTRSPRPKTNRRSLQIRRNAVVVAWLVSAGVLAVLVIGGPLEAWGPWLPLHALLLGGIGSAITVWSAHFADTLLHRPALGGPAVLDARLIVHSLGAALVLVGITASHSIIAMVGVTWVIVAALAGVLAMSVQYRRAVAPRLAALALHYAIALTLLALGATFGYLTSWAQDQGNLALSHTFYIAHTMTMILGFVGTTVLGTLVVLWPTMLRTKMEVEAPRWATRSLPLLVVGTALTAAAGLWQPLALLGVAVYLAGAAGIVIPAYRTARRVPPSSFASASAAAAVLWFLGCVLLLAVRAGLAPEASVLRDVIHALRVPFGVGFAFQILAAALSYLTPVMLGGGPATTRATNLIMDRAAAYRVTAANACLFLAALPWLPWPVRLTAALVAGVFAAWVLIGMVLSVRELLRRRRAGDDDIIARSVTIGPPPGQGSRLPVGALSVQAPSPRSTSDNRPGETS